MSLVIPKKGPFSFAPKLLGESQTAEEMRDLVGKLQHVHLPILITGEAGIGKTFFAEMIHYGKEDDDFDTLKPIFRVYARDISVTEFETFRNQTVLLEHIDTYNENQLAILLQKLSDKPLLEQIRLISTAHLSKQELLQKHPLYTPILNRLSVLDYHILPLRARGRDFEIMLHYFAKHSHIESKLTPTIISYLKSYDWPGNVQELENVLQKLKLVVEQGEPITKSLLDNILNYNLKAQKQQYIGTLQDIINRYFEAHQDCLPQTGLYDRIITQIEKPLIECTLKHVDYNQVQAAQILGINRNTLRKKMASLGIEVAQKTPSKKLFNAHA